MFKDKYGTKRYHIPCDCHTPEHTTYIDVWGNDNDFGIDDDYPECYISTHLTIPFVWYKRLWYGIKYMFGIDSAESASTMICEQQAEEIIKAMDDYLLCVQDYKDNKRNG